MNRATWASSPFSVEQMRPIGPETVKLALPTNKGGLGQDREDVLELRTSVALGAAAWKVGHIFPRSSLHPGWPQPGSAQVMGGKWSGCRQVVARTCSSCGQDVGGLWRESGQDKAEVCPGSGEVAARM
jgi:hypothetical protein